MKITKRQLRRIIKEEKARLREVGIDPENDELRKAAAGLTDDAIYYEALSDLEEELKNAIANALDKGLIIDDLEDAWTDAKTYIMEMGR